MILKALADYSRRDGLLGDSSNFENQPVSWAIEVRADGTFARLRDMRSDVERGKKKVLLGRQKSVPVMDGKRTVNVLPRFLVDNAKYMLALTEKEGDREQERARECHESYVRLLRSASEDTGHSSLQRVLKFLESTAEVAKAAAALQKEKAASNDLITFDLQGEDRFLEEVPELRAWWDKTRSPDESAGAPSQCLVCGKSTSTVRLHSNIKGLRDASSSGVPLVSFNKPAFESYGWSQGENASICQDCDRAYVTALNRFLSDRAVRPSAPDETLAAQQVYLGASITAVYWADDAEVDWVRDLASDPDRARLVLESTRSGKPARARGRFHCLLLQGAEGRATVKSYLSDTLARVEASAERWLRETATVGRGDQETRQHPQWQMLAELTASGKEDKLPKAWPVALYLCSLFDRPVPDMLAHAAVTRNRVMAQVSPARAAILQAWWGRSPYAERKAIVALDEACKEPAYRLGRMLAICDQIQWMAAGGVRVGRTLSDRFYGSLSSRPSIAMGGLMKVTKARLSQLGPGRELAHTRRLGEVMPSAGELAGHERMNLKDQALFALGFYHQRAEDTKKKQQEGDDTND
jgi:CRISPR-associated protein Csd1